MASTSLSKRKPSPSPQSNIPQARAKGTLNPLILFMVIVWPSMIFIPVTAHSLSQISALEAFLESMPILSDYNCSTNSTCGGKFSAQIINFSSSPQISGTIPTQIGQLTSLTYLDFSNCSISGTIPTQIGLAQSLNTIILCSTHIHGTIPTQIGQLTSLNTLILCYTHINGKIPTQIGQLTSLTTLILCFTDISGTIPTEIGQLTSLIILNLTSSQIIGTIPKQIGILTSLGILYLQNTNISGTIPTQIQIMPLLHVLSLSNTSLSGTIPAQLGKLIPYTGIDLSYTQISGTIPTTIASSLLYKLYLQNTHLCGCFPKISNGLTSCDFTGIPHPCNCSFKDNQCSKSPCSNDTLICISTDHNQPRPQPSHENMPKPTPNINIIPSPCSTDCNSIPSSMDHLEYYINNSTIFFGNLHVSNMSSLIIEKNLTIKGNLNVDSSSVTLTDVSLVIEGNFSLTSGTLSLTSNSLLTIHGCVNLTGSTLNLNLNSKKIEDGDSLTVLESNQDCIEGPSYLNLQNISTSPGCQVIGNQEKVRKSSLAVSFAVTCFPLWAIIFVTLMAISLVVIIMVIACKSKIFKKIVFPHRRPQTKIKPVEDKRVNEQ